MKLYTKQGEKLREWVCFADGAEVVVQHGQVGGKITEKRYTAKPKNIGKANATTAEQQAVLEAVAKEVKQLKTGYYRTEEEAMAHVPFFPMKAQNFLDHSAKLKYPLYGQPKLDGQRVMIAEDGACLSKQGEPMVLPTHWAGYKEFAERSRGLDGEAYAGLPSTGGLILQDIISAFRKENEGTKLLKLYVFDLPIKDMPFHLRDAKMHFLTDIPEWVVIVPAIELNSTEEAEAFYEDCIAQGYEGAMFRNSGGMYEFDKRSYDLQKRKKREDAEARILSVEEDKNGDGIVTAELVNGENTGNRFKCLFRKDASNVMNLRRFDAVSKIVGDTFTVEFEAYSGDGIPQKPVGKCLRAVDSQGQPIY